MLCLKEVEKPKSVDGLMTSQSIEERSFPDSERLDAKIVSALKRIISDQHFRRRVGDEEQRAQKHDKVLRGRQITYMIYDNFRATGAHDAAQDLSDLFNVSFQGDEIQDVDARWDQALLSPSEIPKESILQGLLLENSTSHDLSRDSHSTSNHAMHEPAL